MSDTQTPAVAPWGKWDRISLKIILVGGIVYATVLLAVGTIGTITDLVTGQQLLSLTVNEKLPAAADTGTATLVDGRYDSARVFVADLTPATSGLLTAGSIIAIVTQLAVAAVFIYLTWRLLRREPFLRSLTWSFVAAGAVLLLGSIIGQTLSGIGSWLTAAELGATTDSDSFWPTVFTFDAAPLGLAFVLMLVGSAFEYAQKLTVETRGLV